MSSSNRLGELLVREKRISLAQLKQAQDEQKRTGQNLTYALAKLGYISDRRRSPTSSRRSTASRPSTSTAVELDPELGKLVTRRCARSTRSCPISRAGSSLIVAMSDPTNLHAIDDIKFLTGYNVEPVVASENAILAAIEKLFVARRRPQAGGGGINGRRLALGDIADGDVEFGDEEESEPTSIELTKASEDAPVVRLCNAMLLNAIKVRASDIHIEPYEKKHAGALPRRRRAARGDVPRSR
jgi:type IV pilus assembly protein PilB